MTSEYQSITVNDIEVEVVRKPIKNLYLKVNSVDGRVSISVPRHVTDDNIRTMLLSRLSWIEKQQAKIAAQPRPKQPKMIQGESHSLWGKQHVLHVIERHGRHEITMQEPATLRLYVNPHTSTHHRRLVLNAFYRQQLKRQIPGIIDKWQPIIGRRVADWGIKKMKTRWGTCNISQRRIWLNLELAKKSMQCLEFVIVHEMVHLLERYHNARFYAHMDSLLPDWRCCKQELNREMPTHSC